MKNIFVINGSASKNSSNQKLIDHVVEWTKNDFNAIVFNDLKTIPHFDPDLSTGNTPKAILNFRKSIERSDGVLICTPEYIFSVPGGLKNVLEWCVSTSVFSGKPLGIITASANGEKGHEQLQLIMSTVMAQFTPETTLLIQGIKGKINQQGRITDKHTLNELTKFTQAFKKLVAK